ncbi:hypothetical protein Taro_035650 [Colocasia esculenta]|uniref:Uncharacterized protein n=1 Tax=Colocasia esculenta TaxID=4460 RepID=A0A843WJ94_COLES|nr:hypothetical protein [Colocasia esculenta]
MSSRPSKKLASRRRPSSSQADRAEAERKTKHRDDHLPELVVPPRLHLTHSKGTHTKFVQQWYVEFESLAVMFPNLQPLFVSQGWTPFLYHHKRYSSFAIRDFYNNLGYTSDDRFFTTVKGTTFQLTDNLFSTALQIPNSRVDILSHKPDASVYYPLLTLEDYDGNKKISKLNANSFPPLIRMIHHIFTTMIAPKHGSRELVTDVHKSLFTFFLKCEPINLPLLMLRLIHKTFYQPRRSMSFAYPLTSLMRFIDIDIPDTPGAAAAEESPPRTSHLRRGRTPGWRGVPGASAGAADGDPREPHPPFHRRENLSVGGFREEGDRGAGIDDGAARAREGVQGPDGRVDREVDAVDGGALDADRVLPFSSGDSLVMNPKIMLEGVLRAAIGHGDFETSPDLVVTEDINGINAGMFFLQRSRWSEAFLDAWWSQAVFVRFNSTMSGDNHALNHLVGDLPDELRRRHIQVSPM